MERANKNVANGLTYFYQAEMAVAENKLPQAIRLFQQSVIQFHNEFSDTSIRQNPETFNGLFLIFSYLMQSWAKKQRPWRSCTVTTKEPDRPGISTRRVLVRVPPGQSYVERTYDSDEARLFLGKIKHQVHSKPIDISILRCMN